MSMMKGRHITSPITGLAFRPPFRRRQKGSSERERERKKTKPKRDSVRMKSNELNITSYKRVTHVHNVVFHYNSVKKSANMFSG